MDRSAERVMAITGTTRGLGRFLAGHYCEAGWQVYGCGRGEGNLDSPRYQHICTDVSDEAAVRSLFRTIRRDADRLDALINNAGIGAAPLPTMLLPAQSVSETIGVNFLGTFLCSREAAKLMGKRKAGRIINIGSMAVKHEAPALGAIYTASKAAIHAFTRVFAAELHPLGITCNVVAPAVLPTDLADSVEERSLTEILSRNANPDVGTLEDVARVTDWLLTPEGLAVTGQVVYLGGA